MNIYLFPTECESEPFRKLRPEARVVISGVGMVETSATLMRLFTQGDIHEEDVVVLCGIAGSYDEELKVDSVVEVVEECCVELPARFRQSYTNSCATSLRGVRSNTVHTSARSAEGAQVDTWTYGKLEQGKVYHAELSVQLTTGERPTIWSGDLIF